ncbi:hypothetical protein [Aliiglaciecola litoralis]|uniref:Uncharacterized protein n=1 Tax=Aliiglaciecola litoralis TaxID=582857 RepID=A0ABN1LNM2_9ALTE
MKKGSSLSILSILVCCSFNTFAGPGNTMERADVFGQGLAGPVIAVEGARLVRKKNQLLINVRVPTPAPGSYSYPPGNSWNNDAIQGKPEAFSLWAFIFNDPSACVGGGPGICTGADARNGTPGAGAFNVAGHLVAGRVLQLSGNVTFSSSPFGGAPLTDPLTAEVHLAIAPHGALQPETMPNQIQTPIGGPDYWWLATFPPVD